jgi:hypothetical protein
MFRINMLLTAFVAIVVTHQAVTSARLFAPPSDIDSYYYDNNNVPRTVIRPMSDHHQQGEEESVDDELKRSMGLLTEDKDDKRSVDDLSSRKYSDRYSNRVYRRNRSTP